MSFIMTDYLNKTVKKYPDKLAFKDREYELTFRQLKDFSICIANALLAENLFKAPIIVFMEKSIYAVCSFLGVAYSGNFYAPIDTKMPAERIIKIIQTLEPALIITDQENVQKLDKLPYQYKLLVCEEVLKIGRYNEERVNAVRRKIIDTDILYVMFTSGSTGVPKGVIINHKAVVDFVEWITECYGFDENTVFANQAQLYFDLSIQDVYAPLKTGATTILIPDRLFATPGRVWNTIIDNSVNTLVWIPSVLSMFANLDLLAHTKKAHLQCVLFCGEVMPVKQLNYWINQYPDTVFANLYGPTECTEACTYYTIDRIFSDEESLPIGFPCENTRVVIMDDENREITESGKAGELCVLGTSLSMGYYGNSEKTAEVFVQNPSNSKYPELMYKTGDLVEYNYNHELMYVTRKDFQIKHRGYRIELGEIEAAVSSIAGTSYNCCLHRKDDDKIVLVYMGNVSEADLKIRLTQKLQAYMIPDEIHKIDKMFFNANGKIDRKRIAAIYGS